MKPLLIIFSFLFFSTSIFSQQPDQEEKTYETFDIQKMPSFPGGEEQLQQFLADNVYYTQAAYEQNLQGTVALSFVVEKDGSLTDIKVLKDIGGGLGEIAANVMRSSPKWAPGEANGNPVQVKFVLPVRFRLGIYPVRQVAPSTVNKKTDNDEIIEMETYEDLSEAPNTSRIDETAEKTYYQTDEVGKMPEFPGGEAALIQFLADSLYYTPEAFEKNIQGTVAFTFIIGVDGSISDIKILKDPGGGLGKAAVEVMQSSPKWTPGMRKGVPVPVKFTLPARFRLNSVNRIKYPATKTSPAYFVAIDNKKYELTELDKKPEFPGGERALKRYIQEKLNYSEEGKQQAKKSSPVYEFTIEKDGSLSDFRVLIDPGFGMGKEGLRILYAMPKWTPGMKNGKPVRVNYRFKLESE